LPDGNPFSARLSDATGRSAGFDYLRLSLSLAVVLAHVVVIGLGDARAAEIWLSPLRPVIACILPMFFALSGFLVAGSLTRAKRLSNFFWLRIIRIVPALVVEVVVSAVLIGPCFTTLPLAEYFASPSFRRYFWNIVGNVHFALPGVFLDNPHPGVVNEQLWTIPWELDCYLTLGACAVLGLTRRKWLFLAMVAAAHGVVIVKNLGATPDGWISVHGEVLVLSFMAGALLYVFRDEIPWSPALWIGSVVATVLLLLVPMGDALVSFPAAYATVFLGRTNPRRSACLIGGDYSYGIYLYGFPVQQCFASLWPGINPGSLIAIVCAIALAVVSWWFVEKPALALRELNWNRRWLRSGR
jgi:peptidoglycan/LPS O-acetylase OafA/YrhL